jgi:hypothetical protein
MPKTIKNREKRTPISFPAAIIKEVDRIVSVYPIHGNRQQFFETAVREKIMGIWQLEGRIPPDSPASEKCAQKKTATVQEAREAFESLCQRQTD